MTILITVIILLASVILGFFVLIQAPKGGGLTGAFGSLSSQVMGVKQSTDVMEKGTWTSIGAIAILCIVLTMTYPKIQKAERPAGGSSAPAQQQQPKQNTPAPAAPAQPLQGKE
jgi:preprotein translocase subunit SecG